MNRFRLKLIILLSTLILSLIRDLYPLYSLRNPLNLNGLGKIAFIRYILTASSLGVGTGVFMVLSGAGVGRRRA